MGEEDEEKTVGETCGSVGGGGGNVASVKNISFKNNSQVPSQEQDIRGRKPICKWTRLVRNTPRF